MAMEVDEQNVDVPVAPVEEYIPEPHMVQHEPEPELQAAVDPGILDDFDLSNFLNAEIQSENSTSNFLEKFTPSGSLGISYEPADQ